MTQQSHLIIKDDIFKKIDAYLVAPTSKCRLDLVDQIFKYVEEKTIKYETLKQFIHEKPISYYNRAGIGRIIKDLYIKNKAYTTVYSTSTVESINYDDKHLSELITFETGNRSIDKILRYYVKQALVRSDNINIGETYDFNIDITRRINIKVKKVEKGVRDVTVTDIHRKTKFKVSIRKTKDGVVYTKWFNV